ncbi:MAG TPA: helix-turn-helix transcriptional regulator [Thermoanaerobaculia bacterium]|jgi:DNA-binding CsgD family transcriptional regulator
MVTVSEGIRFTERQRQVVQLIAEGCSNVEIADRLGISPRTAKAHSDILRTKLGVGRRRQIPLAFRDATGESPFESLEPTAVARDNSRSAD